MGSITIRNIDDSIKQRLRLRAASHGRSMEEEARSILRATLIENAPSPAPLGERIHNRFANLGGDAIVIAPREPMRNAPTFD